MRTVDADRAVRAKRGRLALAGLCLGFFVVLLDATIVNVALDAIGHSLGSSLRGLQWVLGGYTVTFAALMLSAGSAGDRWGARSMFLAGLAVFAVASAGCAVSPSLPVLVAARVVQGAGAAVVTPCSLALIAHQFPQPAARARALGVWGGVSGVGLAAGPLVGGFLVDALGWRAVFWVVVPFAALSAVLVRAAVARAPRRPAHRADLAGQLTVTLGLVALTAALTGATGAEWHSPSVLGLFGVSMVAWVAFVLVERHSAVPLVPAGMFRHPRLRAVVAFGALFNFGLYGVLFCLALYLEQTRHVGARAAGLVILPMTVAVAVAAALSGKVAHRYGRRTAMLAGMAAGLLGALALAAAGPGTPLWLLAAGGTLLGGVGLAMPAMTSVALDAAPPGNTGLAAGALNAARQAGGALGVAALGALLLDGTGHPTLRLALPVVATGYATALWLAVRSTSAER
ncbi:MAG TPA: MFS transporter [Pseudonocardia sp.]|uniref:MFS transporter n=1 Tax=Pseudonocardia sp. TaxID=60912 RepID=UPI002F414D0D